MNIRPAWQQRADVVVIGTGVAGLAAALAAHRAGRRVVVLSKARRRFGVTATHYAQGGIAVVLPDTKTRSTRTSPTRWLPAPASATPKP